MADDAGIRVHTLPPDCKSLKKWEQRGLFSTVDLDSFDVAVVCSFGFFMPKSLLERFPFSGINVHPSLLPKYRGAAPIDHALLNGDTMTGVSIIELDPRRFDTGRILAQHRHPILPDDTYTGLSAKLAELGGELALDAVHALPQVLDQATPQDEALVVPAPKLDPRIGWQVEWATALQHSVFNLWRAVGERGGVWASLRSPVLRQPRAVRIVGLALPTEADTSAADGHARTSPAGSFVFSKSTKQLLLRCVDGWLRVDRVQIRGRQAVSGADFGASFVNSKATPPGSVCLAPLHD